MKRRFLAAILSAALVLSLAACGGGNKGDNSSNPGGGSSQTDGSTSPDASGGVIGSASGNVVLGPSGASSEENGQPDVSQPDVSEPDPGAGGSAGDNNPSGGGNSGGGSSGGSNQTTSGPKLTLNRTNIELNKAGATFKLRYTADAGISGTATYTSSDAKVATVDSSGKVTAVAPGKVTITVACGGATATASINCNWTESAPEPSQPEPSQPEPSQPGPSQPEPSQPDNPPASSGVDLSAFHTAITGKYEFPMPTLADDEILDNFYPGLTGISTEQRLIYFCGSSMNTGEFGLVQVKDSKDVEAVKAIFQARIDAQASGGAWYPMAVDTWTNNSRVVSNGNYVMMVVHENCDDIVKEFNALF